MQSAFIIRNMDSTPEPPSPNMAAPAKRRFRKCTNCTSRMPSITYDNHTLCIKCRKQVCDMTIVCEECRDWPITKRQVFVDYSNSLRIKRESKQRQARLAAAYASDQSVYETDTDVPVDEPSVPVQNVHVDSLNLGQQECLISEEVIVSAGPSTETATSQFLSLPTGEGLDKLVLSLLTRITDLESTRGLQPPVQNQPIANKISHQGAILPNVCQPSVQSQSAGSRLSQQGVILPNVCQTSVQNRSVGSGISQQSFILPNVCQPSVQARSEISQPGVILPNVCQPVFTNTEVTGVTAPPPLFLNPVQPVFRLPTAPISGDSLQRPIANDQSVQVLQEALASTQQAIASFRDRGLRPHQSLLDSAESLAKNLKDARLSSTRPGVSSSVKPKKTQMGTTRPETTRMTEATQGSPPRPEFVSAVPGPSKRRSEDSPHRLSDYSSRQGSRTPPRKRSRLSGNSSEEDDSYQSPTTGRPTGRRG